MRRLAVSLLVAGLVGVWPVSAGGLAASAGGRAASAGDRAASAGAADPLCQGNYASARARAGQPLRFGVDPGIAGSVGANQQPAVPDNQTRDLAALAKLRPPRRALVLRLNRLFWSEGQAGIARFRRMARRYARAGFEVEIQVRYHPNATETGDLAAWTRYVRHVVDSFGDNRRVVAMTITNEVNVAFSPNTSDGFYPRARDALIRGVEAAHREALRRGYRQLRFGFTYAYRFVPVQDAAFFAYLRRHGGQPFIRALGFIGLDFYPGMIYPPTIAPGAGYRPALAQAAGVVRNCLAPRAGIGRRVPIWITENGISSATHSAANQARGLRELVRAVHAYSGTFNITDYRWFNLRDSVARSATPPGPLSFAFDGLLRADYHAKPAFAAYRALIRRFGASADPLPAP